MVSRRALLKTGGAAAIVLCAGGGATILTRNIDPVREPWERATDGFGDPRLDALSYAILAPSPHNRQPWLIRLEGSDSLRIFCDLSRLLPETDPPNRQIVIGFGAFLELLRQAAAEGGHRLEIDSFPEGAPQPVLDSRPIARVTFVKDPSVKRDPLFGLILARRTARVAFDTNRQVSGRTLEALQGQAKEGLSPGAVVVGTARDGERVGRLKDFCRESWEIEMQTQQTLMESVELTRIGAEEVNTSPDGISLHGPKIEALRLLGMVNRKGMSQVGSVGHQATLDFYNNLIDTAMAFGWITTPTNTRADQLRAGTVWVRLNLAATLAGLGMHPLSQVLQEFPAMDALYSAFHREVGVDAPARVQGLFRFGYAESPDPAPRWPLDSRLIVS